MDSQTTCEEAREICQKTHDGEDLAPHHLKLLENAVNGFLTDAGVEAFKDLCAQVKKGYVKPWFCGIEHLTITHAGHVYWRDTKVEHFAFARDQWRECKRQAVEVGRRCRILERRGEKPTVKAVIFDWPE